MTNRQLFYLIKLDTRSPASGCESPWYLGSAAPISLRVAHTIDGVAPGQVIEGDSFRVYSRTCVLPQCVLPQWELQQWI